MAKEFLAAGKIVSTHGLKGEMRLQAWSDEPSFLSSFESVYIDENGSQELKIISAKAHKNICLLRLEGIDSIEKAEKLRNTVIYIKKSSALLEEGTFFVDDIIGIDIIDEANGENLGKVSDVVSYPANDVWFVKTPNNKQVLIPNVPHIIKRVSLEQNCAYIYKMKGLFDDED